MALLYVRGKVNGVCFCFEFTCEQFNVYKTLMTDNQQFVNAVKTSHKDGIIGPRDETIQTISRFVGDLEELIYNKSPNARSTVTQSSVRAHKDQIEEEIVENVQLNDSDKRENLNHDTEFTTYSTKFLLVKVAEYLKEVGPMKMFKTKKLMWKQISSDLKEEYGLERDGEKCENKYKCVVKNYKAAVDKNHTSGNSRVKLPYEEEMGLIAANDDSIIPAVLASQKGIQKVKPKRKKNCIPSSSEDEPEVKEEKKEPTKSSQKRQKASDSEDDSDEDARQSRNRSRRRKKLSVGEYYFKAAKMRIEEEKKWRTYKMKTDEKKLRLLEKLTKKPDSDSD